MGDSAAVASLPPIIVPRGQDLSGAPLQESASPMPASAGVVVTTDISGLDQYPTMLWLLTASGVLDEIDRQPVTIFAPDEAAFRDFAVADRYDLMANPATPARSPTSPASSLRCGATVGLSR